jgi:hypothetical protein
LREKASERWILGKRVSQGDHFGQQGVDQILGAVSIFRVFGLFLGAHRSVVLVLSERAQEWVESLEILHLWLLDLLPAWLLVNKQKDVLVVGVILLSNLGLLRGHLHHGVHGRFGLVVVEIVLLLVVKLRHCLLLREVVGHRCLPPLLQLLALLFVYEDALVQGTPLVIEHLAGVFEVICGVKAVDDF